jgi:hypothetical protein
MSTHRDVFGSVNETETRAEVNGQLPSVRFSARFRPLSILLMWR